MSDTRLPNFLIIGAPKSGTTSLYHYLKEHPQVWMPALKEPHWFLFDGPEVPNWGGPYDAMRQREMIRTWQAYRALFSACPPGQVCGEASVRYLYSPQACAAIRRRLPEVRLVVILRNPVDRAYSAYTRDRFYRNESCATFAEAIADTPRRRREGWLIGAHQDLGLYARALEPWLRIFGNSRLRVYLFDDLVADPAGLVRDLYQFIGVDADFVPDLSKRHNVTGEIANPLLRYLRIGLRPLCSHLLPLVPMALRGRIFVISRLRVRKAKSEPLDPALRARLIDAYRDDIKTLAALLGRNLDAWLDPEPAAAQQPDAAAPSRLPPAPR